MKTQSLISYSALKVCTPRTTDSRHGKLVAPNLLLTLPLPVAPDKVWVGDITYIPLVNGGAAVTWLPGWIDQQTMSASGPFSRIIVGGR